MKRPLVRQTGVNQELINQQELKKDTDVLKQININLVILLQKPTKTLITGSSPLKGISTRGLSRELLVQVDKIIISGLIPRRDVDITQYDDILIQIFADSSTYRTYRTMTDFSYCRVIYHLHSFTQI
ncbi:hypothetical protein CHS0354_003564 [Potamilus streckersoni]|uniref:Uncharacterized protein n=1 Tax=Potamilus streckersoni TaxID=2493646 RepID=A0AAE0RVE3_9BIVA|nr:hypothetical protein CHS0354_003564 [Potamilus streckersoni]